jgi:hypothetical protein
MAFISVSTSLEAEGEYLREDEDLLVAEVFLAAVGMIRLLGSSDGGLGGTVVCPLDFVAIGCFSAWSWGLVESRADGAGTRLEERIREKIAM